MGLNYSTPVPTDADFAVQHKPLDVPSLSKKKIPHVESSFRVHCDAWNKGATFEALDIRLVPCKHNDQCLIQDMGGAVLAVLLPRGHKKISICTLSPSGKNQTSIGEYRGNDLYEYAVVWEKVDRYRHFLAVQDYRYRLERCGSKFGPKDLVVVQEQDGGSVCASFMEEPEKMQRCRVAPGVDPVLVLAFAVCSHKIRALLEEMIKKKSGVTSTKMSNMFK